MKIDIAEMRKRAEAASRGAEPWWTLDNLECEMTAEDAAHVHGCSPDAILALLHERDRYREALRLPLLFHGGDWWDMAVRGEWHKITGSDEATTKAMCDHIRAALAGADANEAKLKGGKRG